MISDRLNGAGEELCKVFRVADEAAYAGAGYRTSDLPQWRERIRQQLNWVGG